MNLVRRSLDNWTRIESEISRTCHVCTSEKLELQIHWISKAPFRLITCHFLKQHCTLTAMYTSVSTIQSKNNRNHRWAWNFRVIPIMPDLNRSRIRQLDNQIIAFKMWGYLHLSRWYWIWFWMATRLNNIYRFLKWNFWSETSFRRAFKLWSATFWEWRSVG